MWCKCECPVGAAALRSVVPRGAPGCALCVLASARPAGPTLAGRRAGFTLIELIVVIVVIAVLAGLVGPMVLGNVSDAKIQAARAQIELFGLALDAYRLDNDVYPTTEQGLAALRALPTSEPVPRRWRGPYLRKEVPLDPWGRPYVYRSPGEVNPSSYDLLSLGRDGTPGGEGEDADITSWGGEGASVPRATPGRNP